MPACQLYFLLVLGASSLDPQSRFKDGGALSLFPKGTLLSGMTLPTGESGSLVPIYLIKVWDFKETLLLLLLPGDRAGDQNMA